MRRIAGRPAVIYDAHELAYFLQGDAVDLTAADVERWADSGLIPSFKVDGAHRFDLVAVLDVLAALEEDAGVI